MLHSVFTLKVDLHSRQFICSYRRKPQQPTNILHSLQRPHTFQSFPLVGWQGITAQQHTSEQAYQQLDSHRKQHTVLLNDKYMQFLYLQNKNRSTFQSKEQPKHLATMSWTTMLTLQVDRATSSLNHLFKYSQLA